MATTAPPRSPRRLALAGCALAVLLGAAACGDDEDDPVSAGDGTTLTTAARADETSTTASSPDYGRAEGGSTAGATIEAVDFTFTSATVAPGAQVTFDNADSAPHTVTADDGAFDSGRVEGGASGTLTAPAEPGQHTFHCEIHPDMTGTLTVEG